MSMGREFHNLGAHEEKALSPYEENVPSCDLLIGSPSQNLKLLSNCNTNSTSTNHNLTDDNLTKLIL